MGRKESIKQTKALSDNWSWKPILVFFLSGHLRQVLLEIGRYNSPNENFEYSWVIH